MGMMGTWMIGAGTFGIFSPEHLLVATYLIHTGASPSSPYGQPVLAHDPRKLKPQSATDLEDSTQDMEKNRSGVTNGLGRSIQNTSICFFSGLNYDI